ncbi:MAG: hypothetical protein OEY91_15560 [Nitrospirota bacterium]|nr:hypothetical protein [Nitrospirota bacterium]
MGKDVTSHPPFTTRKLVRECLPHLAFVSLYLVVAESARVLFPWLPLLCMSLGILSLYYVGWGATLKKRSEKSLKYSYGQDDLVLECSCVVGLLIMFGLFFQNLHGQFPDFFIVEGKGTYLNWLVFTVENIFESVVDVLTIYDIKFSGIQPNHAASKTIILLFRLTVNVVLLILMIRNWRNLRGYWQLHKKGNT